MYVSSILCYDTNDLNLDKTFINRNFEDDSHLIELNFLDGYLEKAGIEHCLQCELKELHMVREGNFIFPKSTNSGIDFR